MVYKIIIFMLWFTSGNYHTLVARQHKHFFCNVYFIKTIFFYGCYGPFYSPDFIYFFSKCLNKSDGERVKVVVVILFFVLFIKYGYTSVKLCFKVVVLNLSYLSYASLLEI